MLSQFYFTYMMPIFYQVTLALIIGIFFCTCLHTQGHEGGFSMIEQSAIKDYINYLDNARYNRTWHYSVRKLAKTINSDPTIRFNWEYGISQSKNLENKTSKDVLNMLNTIISVGPKYIDHSGNPYGGLIGFPINVLFIHLMQTENGRTLFSNQKFNKALRRVLDSYGEMLETPASLTYLNTNQPDGWFSRKALAAAADYSLFKCDPTKPHYGFKSWHQWFLRQFKPGARKVGAGSPKGIPQSNIIVSSCESTPLSHPLQPSRGVNATSPFWLKDEQYSLTDMFGKKGIRKGYWSLFVGGTVYQAFLSALSYHHWHSPVDGQIVDVYKIPGTYFYDRSQFLQKFDYASPDQSQSFISATAAKMVFIIKADNPRIGYVGLIYIGMAECSGVQASKEKGQRVKKGDHIGNFLFGGSSYTMIFQKDAKLTFAPNLYSTENGAKKSRNVQLNEFLAYVS